VLRGGRHEAILWNGPVLELARDGGRLQHLGPDILETPPRLDEMLVRLRGAAPARPVGDALLDQRLVSGIGNVWRAEALWAARVSPWRPLDQVSDDELHDVLAIAHRLMRASLEGARPLRQVYRRVGRACHRCGAIVRSQPHGEHGRIAYWCPGCQR
jgi:endonuclease-8